MQTTSQMPRPGAWKIFLIWASIGLQSFGGGTSTTFLIIREFVEKRGWMTMEDYLHLWSLCFFAPGINLVALTILIGKRLGGALGVISALAGMLLPSVVITCLLSAGFQLIRHLTAVQAILKGVIPATAGLMLLVAFSTAQPQLKTARKRGVREPHGGSHPDPAVRTRHHSLANTGYRDAARTGDPGHRPVHTTTFRSEERNAAA